MKVKKIISVILCVMMVVCCIPTTAVKAESYHRKSTSICDESQLRKTYLGATNDEAVSEYQSGAFMFPISKATLKMKDFSSFKVFREGGTKGKASVKVKTIDMTAQYGIDYKIYTDDISDAKPVDGQAAPYYNLSGYTFLPTISKSGTVIESNKHSQKELSKIRDISDQYNDAVLDGIMPVSSEFTLNFADGENEKTIYIETLQKNQVLANLDFTLNLSDATNGSLGAQKTSAITIEETREKPQTFLSVSDTTVNPKSEEAYVTVLRTGNMGTFGSFMVRTKSLTAVANNAYTPVQLSLDFTPGMEKIEIPIKMLDGAKNDTKFNLSLEDAKNATIKDNIATVSVNNSVKKELSHETAVSSSITSTSTQRGKVIVDASQLSVCTHTNRGTGKQKEGYDINNNYTQLYYDNGIASKNNCISVRSNEKIDFSGVKKLSFVIDNLTGSCSWDDNAIYVADDDKFNSNTSNYDWIHNLGGVGGSWDMTNVGDGHIVRTTSELNQSLVGGEHYLYIALHKGGFSGIAKFKIQNQLTTNVQNNILLNMQDYSLSIQQPDKTQIYENGTLTNGSVANNILLGDPAATKDDKSGKTNVTIYRDETAPILYTEDTKYQGLAKLKGVVFVDPDNSTKVSSLCPLESDSFTLTGEMLRTYSDFIKSGKDSNNKDVKKIIIKPVFDIPESNVTIKGFDRTSTTGQKFVVDNDSCSGKYYYKNKFIGTVSWTKSERENNNYNVADSLRFKFDYADSSEVRNWTVNYSVRSASTEQLLSSAVQNTYHTGTNTTDIQLQNEFVSILPEFISYGVPSMKVTNPEDGDFCGNLPNDSRYYEQDGSNAIVKGYPSENGKSEILFKDLTVSQVMILSATPNDGYRAKWQYTDAVSRDIKTYYGSTFFYAIQNPYENDDNMVTLSFEKISSTDIHKVHIYGNTQIQNGSVINPPTSDTKTYSVASNVSVAIDGNYGMSDENGEFFIADSSSTDKSPASADIMVGANEKHRVLSTFNNQYFISDIDMSDCDFSKKNDDGSVDVKVDVKMPYKTYGVTPTSINAYDNSGNTYGDTITLITASAVQFDLAINRIGEQNNKPVNMIRWTVEGDDSIAYSEDVDIDSNQSTCHWAQTLSEIAKQGEKLYVEIFNVSYDSSANAVYTGYGKFDTGYNFVASTAYETVTYAPDIGAPSKLTQPVPVLGGVSPTFSIKGFTPIINTGSVGKDENGNDIKTITIGVSIGAAKDEAAKNSSWGTASPLDKVNQLVKVLGNVDKANNSNEGLPKFAAGAKLGKIFDMHTAVKVSFSGTLAFQGNYYVDKDTGDWKFVSQYGIIGTGGSIRVSIPFVLFYVPCFAYITASIDANAYFGIFPQTKDGNQVALTLDQLDDDQLSDFQGVYEVKFSLGVGVGIGYDGVLSASGSLTAKFDIQFNNFLRGYGDFDLVGGITLELIFIKYSWSDSLFKSELFNTLNDNTSTQAVQSALNEFTKKDILSDVTIGDMKLEEPKDTPTTNELIKTSATKGNLNTQSTSQIYDPEMISIGDGKYLVAAIGTDSNNNKIVNNLVNYMIYDSNTGKITEQSSVLRKAINDYMDTKTDTKNDKSKNAKNLSALNQSIYRLDSNVQMTDCGDDIVLVWNKAAEQFSDDTDSSDMLKSVGIASIYYNKKSGKFHDYHYMHNSDSNIAYLNPKVAYNSSTKSVQMFYQKINMSDVTDNTTLEEFQDHPTTLETVVCNNCGDWQGEKKVAINGNALKYYDVASYKDNIMLSYVSSNTFGYTLDGVDGYEFEDHFDSSEFGNSNSLFVQSFNNDNDSISSSKPVCITGKDYVVANPQFVKINNDKCDNLLLFYKCNGQYAYQNINTLLTQAVYTNSDGDKVISDDYLDPIFVTNEDEHEINDDFRVVYNEDGNIYALWTTTEGDGQQIWARSFVSNGYDKVEGSPVYDDNGNVKYDSDKKPILKKFDEPIYLLNGYWGGKVYLTQPKDDEKIGSFKKNFCAAVLDNGNLLVPFNSYNCEYKDNETKMVDNKFSVGEFITAPVYKMPDSVDDIQFSNNYPESGETITATLTAQNTGIQSGKDATVTLFVNGSEYSKQTIPVWLSDQTNKIDFEYTLPNNQTAENVKMYYTISQNNQLMATSDTYSLSYGSSLQVQSMAITPIQNIDDNTHSAKYNVTAKVKNIGNTDYEKGKYLRLAECDMEELTKSMRDDYSSTKPIYTCYGGQELSNIKAGEYKIISFNTDEISEDTFKKYAGDCSIYLEGIICNSDKWTKTYANDKTDIESEYYEGLTDKAVESKANKITADNLTVEVGKTSLISKTVSPKSALITNDIKYTSSDESIAIVNSFGLVTGVSKGTANIKIEINGKTTTSKVTVNDTKADKLLGDVDGDGRITVKDVTAIQRQIAQLDKITPDSKLIADVNSNGSITIIDATEVLKYVSFNSSKYPIGKPIN